MQKTMLIMMAFKNYPQEVKITTYGLKTAYCSPDLSTDTFPESGRKASEV